MIWQRQWDDPPTFHDALRIEILQRAASTPSHPSHNQGGWRSDDKLLDWPLDAVRALRTHLEQAVVEVAATTARRYAYKLRAWAIVNRDGSYHRRHVHGESVWSGIYYVDPGDPGSDCACTVFETAPKPTRIAPVAGLMVVFPSMMWHSVEPHRGVGTRITIAFDAR